MNHKYRIGIDLGGTKIEGIILDTEGNEYFFEVGYGGLLIEPFIYGR